MIPRVDAHGHAWRPEQWTEERTCPECGDGEYSVRPIQFRKKPTDEQIMESMKPENRDKEMDLEEMETYMFACLKCNCVWYFEGDDGRPMPIEIGALPS